MHKIHLFVFKCNQLKKKQKEKKSEETTNKIELHELLKIKKKKPLKIFSEEGKS